MNINGEHGKLERGYGSNWSLTTRCSAAWPLCCEYHPAQEILLTPDSGKIGANQPYCPECVLEMAIDFAKVRASQGYPHWMREIQELLDKEYSALQVLEALGI